MTLLYHKIANTGRYATSFKTIQNHYAYFSKNHLLVNPGNTLNKSSLQICFSFDDATCDFYEILFPYLVQNNLSATLSVPVSHICQNRDSCTWNQLQEMAKYPLLHIASHSYSHRNLLESSVDLGLEIVSSKKVLEDKLQIPITTFVYPMGIFSKDLHRYVKKYYTYIMRIGNAINYDWHNVNNLIYRIPLDGMAENKKPNNYIFYTWNFFLNSLRGR